MMDRCIVCCFILLSLTLDSNVLACAQLPLPQLPAMITRHIGSKLTSAQPHFGKVVFPRVSNPRQNKKEIKIALNDSRSELTIKIQGEQFILSCMQMGDPLIVMQQEVVEPVDMQDISQFINAIERASVQEYQKWVRDIRILRAYLNNSLRWSTYDRYAPDELDSLLRDPDQYKHIHLVDVITPLEQHLFFESDLSWQGFELSIRCGWNTPNFTQSLDYRFILNHFEITIRCNAGQQELQIKWHTANEPDRNFYRRMTATEARVFLDVLDRYILLAYMGEFSDQQNALRGELLLNNNP